MPQQRPRIGLTCSVDLKRRSTEEDEPRLRLNLNYADAVLQASGLPTPLIPTTDNADVLKQQLDEVQGLIITGGPDVPPEMYGQEPHSRTKPAVQRRIQYEFELFRLAEERQMPILAVCLGCQIVNVARGGTLHQHLGDLASGANVCHHEEKDYVVHPVRIEGDSLLGRVIGKQQIETNSSHHQAIDVLGNGLRPVAWAPDGIIEAVEDPARPFLLAVQWHPEALANLSDHAALFAALVRAAAG